MRHEARVAMVTGAAHGIGAATAVRLAQEGAWVAAIDVDATGLQTTVERLRAEGGTVLGLTGDVSRRADVERVVQAVRAQYRRLDVLVNNAGINRDAMATRMTDEQWDTVLGVNLKGTFLCCQAAFLVMREQNGGCIVNTSSISAEGNIGQANYAASKAGVIGLTRTLALEWARYGIRVNCVAPGGTDTRMTASIPEHIREQLLERIPLKRFARPEEIAAAHAYLASDDASYVTGQVLFVDGGATIGA